MLEFFGPEVRLSDIDVAALTAYESARRRHPAVRDGTRIASQAILHEIHALSSLFKRAVAEGRAEVNPVPRLPQKPEVERREAEYLEIGEAARLLKAAGDLDGGRAGRRVRFLRPLLATFLLTGGRAQEVLGLLREDVDLVNGQVHFRPNRYRALKRPRHRRWIPLWPQLREILTLHLDIRSEGALIFPSASGGMIKDLRSALASAVKRAKIEKLVTPHTFRHTYAATRLQTMDHGQPVSAYTVMRELGHSSLSLIEKTYGHLLEVRVRSAVVEYREAKVVPFRKRAEGK
ncbi:MAG: tyrosine-type recombinase/integrase [Gemmatimonadota bacterium]